jgi:hypothetical protein
MCGTRTKMDDRTNTQKDDHKELVRRHLKVLLLHLAARSENPSFELEALLHDVINELHREVKDALEAKKHLRLVAGPGPSDILNWIPLPGSSHEQIVVHWTIGTAPRLRRFHFASALNPLACLWSVAHLGRAAPIQIEKNCAARMAFSTRAQRRAQVFGIWIWCGDQRNTSILASADRRASQALATPVGAAGRAEQIFRIPRKRNVALKRECHRWISAKERLREILGPEGLLRERWLRVNASRTLFWWPAMLEAKCDLMCAPRVGHENMIAALFAQGSQQAWSARPQQMVGSIAVDGKSIRALPILDAKKRSVGGA